MDCPSGGLSTGNWKGQLDHSTEHNRCEEGFKATAGTESQGLKPGAHCGASGQPSALILGNKWEG